MKGKNSFFFIVALSLALLLYSCFSVTEEEQILQRLEELRVMAEITEPLHPLQQAATARQMGNFFADPASFDFREAGYDTIRQLGRQELIQHIVRGRAKMESLEIDLSDSRVTVQQDRAAVEFTGSALGSMPSAEGQFLEIHRIHIVLQKIDGDWLIESVVHLRNERGDEGI